MSLEKQSGVIWMDGEYMPWGEANVHVLTHTLHYGLGAFEGVRAYATDRGPSIFRLQDHTRRLFESAKILNMQVPYTPDELNRVQCELVQKNELDSAYLRPMIFLGGGSLGLHAKGLKTRVVVAAWSWGAYLGDEGMEKGIKVRTSSYRRIHVDSLHAKAKANGHYINSMLALQEALAAGCDEALLLDHQGCVAEGSGENFFMVRGDTLYTPKKTAILEGITRETIITLAQEMGYRVEEADITRDQVYVADEAFFTGTAAEVTPIRELDGRVIGSGGRGPVTERLQRNYLDLVAGKLPEIHPEWVCPVSDVTSV